MRKFQPDALDLKILDLLEENCNLGYREVADKLDKNIWNIRDRIIHLKERGVIKSCRADINYAEIGLGCRAMISLNVSAENIDRFIPFIKSNNMFKRLVITTGVRRFHIEAVGKECNEIRLFAMKNFPAFKVEDVEFEVILDTPL
ncbi:MAG: Lrp/AsnC family transcriptional regulator [Thermoplasmatales archaeon]